MGEAAGVEDVAPGAGDDAEPSAVHDLGLSIEAVGDELHGVARVEPTMWTPGTTALRIAVAATWADALLGLHAVGVVAPRLPVTLELDVHLFDEVADAEEIRACSHAVKVGRAVIVTAVELRDQRDRLVGTGGGSFMVAPDPQWTMEPLAEVLERFSAARGHLAVPLAERIGCERVEPGVAVLPCTPAVHNASKAINGGLMALAIEEAALSADPGARRIESLHVRFLRAVRVGPALARADVHHGLGRVTVTDESTGELAAVATTRSAGTHPTG